jgi:electron transport complex protein RnfG
VKEILRLVVVLTLICSVSGLTLAYVKDKTEPIIEKNQLEQVQKPAMNVVLVGYDNNPIDETIKLEDGVDKRGKKVFRNVFPAKKGGQLIGLAMAGKGKGYGGDIGVMVGIDPAGKLTGIVVMNHSETPGIGSRVTVPAFSNQFKGKELEKATAVDGVSGATFSTKGVFEAVQTTVAFYQKNKTDILAKAGGK